MSNHDIIAHVRMEECYLGLSLIFGDNQKSKTNILNSLDAVQEETKLTPLILEKVLKDRPECQSIYLEFREDINREAGDFFTRILKKLDIEKCEAF